MRIQCEYVQSIRNPHFKELDEQLQWYMKSEKIGTNNVLTDNNWIECCWKYQTSQKQHYENETSFFQINQISIPKDLDAYEQIKSISIEHSILNL